MRDTDDEMMFSSECWQSSYPRRERCDCSDGLLSGGGWSCVTWAGVWHGHANTRRAAQGSTMPNHLTEIPVACSRQMGQSRASRSLRSLPRKTHWGSPVVTGKDASWWGFCGSLPKRLLLNLDAITDHVTLARAKTNLVDAGDGRAAMMPSQARIPLRAEHGYFTVAATFPSRPWSRNPVCSCMAWLGAFMYIQFLYM